ncbi:uncharacterized protein LOC102711629 [Oryza brachyantha]|uniref:uncharacterized protein LOC102711629 n=1 Tax=Oryza brachyantha TaxID=4533 RepID=UPI0003EADDA6|nr:uncharacterized protein LOC102711629 [Oryza brachyantha]
MSNFNVGLGPKGRTKTSQLPRSPDVELTTSTYFCRYPRHLIGGNYENVNGGGTSTLPQDLKIGDISMSNGESGSSDKDNRGGMYGIEHDPAKRTPISEYDINDQDSIRRAYIALGPCQPKMKAEDFSQHNCGASNHGGDTFVNGGFRNWNMKRRFHKHVGAINSAHCQAEEKYNLFMKPKSSIHESFASNSAQYKMQYEARLTWSLKCIRYLLAQGLAFHGHDESKTSENRRNFRALLQWLARNFEEVNKVVFGNAPGNCQMIDHKIQKQLITSCAHETTKFVIEELGDECFAVLADESSDAYQQEQLALCLRFVNKIGEPVERFLGLVHVEDTMALTLKEAIKSLLLKYQLPLSIVRGQGYDGASNMKGHRLLRKTPIVLGFFGQLAYLLNVLGMSWFESRDGPSKASALQKREQDVMNAMDLLELTKHKVKVVDMDAKYKPIQRARKFYKDAFNYHRFHADMFLGVIDRQIQEFSNRFDEVNTELLRCMAAFSPTKGFSAFNREMLLKLAGFYPHDFSFEEMNQLTFQLNLYFSDVSKDENFTNLRSLAELSKMLVTTEKSIRHYLVYRLLKLVLILSVATAGVERVFSSMNYIKNKLRSKMGQQYLNDCLVTFIEREFFFQVKDKDIITYFQNMEHRKVVL